LSQIWNLIAQKDNQLNQEIAADSKEIALASKRDSSAMKAIAALTMFFLPGTFIASLFAMPLLDWQAEAGQPVISHRFWIYWAVTIPLTLLVVILWIGWLLWSLRQQSKENARVREHTGRILAHARGHNTGYPLPVYGGRKKEFQVQQVSI
jgi:hypothetical protein